MCLEFIENLTNFGGFKPGAGINPLVSRVRGPSIYLEMCRKLDDVTDDPYNTTLDENRLRKPKAWRYTTHLFRDIMRLHACYEDRTRPFSLWFGNKFVADAIDTQKAIAPWARRRLNDRLRRLLGQGNYAFWFTVEGTPENKRAIHAHGILEVTDPVWWEDKKKYRKLRDSIRYAVGTDTPVQPSHQLDTPATPMDQGWITYCRKYRLSRLRSEDYGGTPPPEIGYPTRASSGGLGRRTSDIYEQCRSEFLWAKKTAEQKYGGYKGPIAAL